MVGMFSQCCRLDLGKCFVKLYFLGIFNDMDPLRDQPSIVLIITHLIDSMKDDVIAGDFIFRTLNCIPAA